jgi:hypothetical protein
MYNNGWNPAYPPFQGQHDPNNNPNMHPAQQIRPPYNLPYIGQPVQQPQLNQQAHHQQWHGNMGQPQPFQLQPAAPQQGGFNYYDRQRMQNFLPQLPPPQPPGPAFGSQYAGNFVQHPQIYQQPWQPLPQQYQPPQQYGGYGYGHYQPPPPPAFSRTVNGFGLPNPAGLYPTQPQPAVMPQNQLPQAAYGVQPQQVTGNFGLNNTQFVQTAPSTTWAPTNLPPTYNAQPQTYGQNLLWAPHASSTQQWPYNLPPPPPPRTTVLPNVQYPPTAGFAQQAIQNQTPTQLPGPYLQHMSSMQRQAGTHPQSAGESRSAVCKRTWDEMNAEPEVAAVGESDNDMKSVTEQFGKVMLAIRSEQENLRRNVTQAPLMLSNRLLLQS